MAGQYGVIKDTVVGPNVRAFIVANTERLSVEGGECWLWKRGAHRSRGGYPLIYIGGSRSGLNAARVSWLNYIGPLEEGARVMRSCGNALCVAPEHLYLRGVDSPEVTEAKRVEKYSRRKTRQQARREAVQADPATYFAAISE